MAPAAPSAEQTADLLQNLSLEKQSKAPPSENTTKKPSEVKGVPVGSYERSTAPAAHNVMNPDMFYASNGFNQPYYYRGSHESNDYSRWVYSDGTGGPPPTDVYGDHGSVMYTYNYPSLGGYHTVPTMGRDGQLYNAHPYMYPTYCQPLLPNGSYAPSISPTSQRETPTSATLNQVVVNAEAVNGNSNTFPINSFSSMNGSNARGMLPSGMLLSDGSLLSNGHGQLPINAIDHPSNTNQNVLSVTSQMGLHHPIPVHGFMRGMHSTNQMYGLCGKGIRGVPVFGSGFDSQRNGSVNGKHYYRGRINWNGLHNYGNRNSDGLNELNRGPRSGYLKNLKELLSNNDQSQSPNDNREESNLTPDKNQYNREDLPVNYTDAKFYIIKSYSEDDIHKSIKYNIWASTPNGNKKLNDGYGEAKNKSGSCPIFLFYSVNTSGQFLGVAEMVGAVDFNKKVEYWQQDKWNGCFAVKWHIVKDVPNSLLKHIILENNENKPVTNSRDTQEVKLEQGMEMLSIFKDYVSKTSILDDFSFYEARQKVMEEKRIKQQQFHKVQDVKTTEASILEESKEVDLVVQKEPSQSLEERKVSAENIDT